MAHNSNSHDAPVVQFAMYFHSEFLEIWKAIYFWKR